MKNALIAALLSLALIDEVIEYRQRSTVHILRDQLHELNRVAKLDEAEVDAANRAFAGLDVKFRWAFNTGASNGVYVTIGEIFPLVIHNNGRENWPTSDDMDAAQDSAIQKAILK